MIDLQKGIVGLPTVHPSGEIIGRAAQLARAFRERGLPVVLVNVSGRLRAAPMPDAPKFSFPPIGPTLFLNWSSNPATTSSPSNEWARSSARRWMKPCAQRGVTQVFLTGVATSLGVESTARSAYDHGYNVVFVVDAITDRDADAHRYCVEKIFPRLGETSTTGNVLKVLNEAPAR